MYYRDRSIISADAREWQSKVLMYLEDPKTQYDVNQFKSNFDPNKHGLDVNLQFYYPKSELITKKGQISTKSFDLSNVEKPIIDLLTSERYSTENCKNLEIDDKNLIFLSSTKGICDRHVIIVQFKLIEHSEIPVLKLTEN